MSRRKRKIRKIFLYGVIILVFMAGGKLGKSVAEGVAELKNRLFWKQPEE